MSLKATPEMYKEFIDTILWIDIKDYILECIELNRDLLEGLRGGLTGTESDEALRGRNRQLREFVAYVERMAEGGI